MFFGNLFVYFQFQGKTNIDAHTRRVIFTALCSVAIVGVIFLTMLKRSGAAGTLAVITDDQQQQQQHQTEKSRDVDAESTTAVVEAETLGVWQAFRAAVRLFFTREMLLLSITFVYTGLELSFFSGVYSPSIGFTLAMGDGVKQLVGLSGICIGVGEVSGGVLFGLLGSSRRFGRDLIVIAGMALHLISFALIFANLPDEAPFGDTTAIAYLNPPSRTLALLCSVLLGFGDACFNTQIYSMLGGVFAQQSAAAFAIFKFAQSLAAAASFVYSSHVGLSGQMGILCGFGVVGTVCFCTIEWSQRRRADELAGEHSGVLTEDSTARLSGEGLVANGRN